MDGNFEYKEGDFVWPTKNTKLDDMQLSKYDINLREKWDKGQKEGYFRYKLDKLETRILQGKYGFVAQLNLKRAEQRRAPQDIRSVAQPFNADNFNFTKIKNEEILFTMSPTWKFKESVNGDSEEKNGGRHLLIINVSPLEYCNSLLVPLVDSQLPQIATEAGIRLALESVLLSSSRNLKVGFNSLCAYASVNHQHYHLYYLKESLYLETVEVERLCGPCYTLGDHWPAKGFAFQLERNDITSLVRNVYKLTSFLIRKNHAHNLMLTRGCGFGSKDPSSYDTVRVFVWAREPSYGVKDDFAFNIACCEISGHLPMKNQNSYETITEENVTKILNETTQAIYEQVKPQVYELFKDES